MAINILKFCTSNL